MFTNLSAITENCLAFSKFQMDGFAISRLSLFVPLEFLYVIAMTSFRRCLTPIWLMSLHLGQY